jgi:hypothetical protein
MANKYAQLLIKEIIKKKPQPGTMPADMRVIRQVLEAKFADKKFTEGLLNDFISAKGVSVKMK